MFIHFTTTTDSDIIVNVDTVEYFRAFDDSTLNRHKFKVGVAGREYDVKGNLGVLMQMLNAISDESGLFHFPYDYNLDMDGNIIDEEGNVCIPHQRQI